MNGWNPLYCHLLGVVPGGAGWHVLRDVVDVLGGVDGEVVRQAHQVHHLSHVEVPGPEVRTGGLGSWTSGGEDTRR